MFRNKILQCNQAFERTYSEVFCPKFSFLFTLSVTLSEVIYETPTPKAGCGILLGRGLP